VLALIFEPITMASPEGSRKTHVQAAPISRPLEKVRAYTYPTVAGIKPASPNHTVWQFPFAKGRATDALTSTADWANFSPC